MKRKKQRTVTIKKRAFPTVDYLSLKLKGCHMEERLNLHSLVLSIRTRDNMTSGRNIFVQYMTLSLYF